MNVPAPPPPLPYRIATLCYLFDAQGRVLLLHRRKPPNRDLYSPIGGKLDQVLGESPLQCAQREIHEEAGLDLPMHRLHLTGIVAERGFEDRMHWLMFLVEVTDPVEVTRTVFGEGTLEWYSPEQIFQLPIPATDRDVIWPMFWQHRGGFFSVSIDCRDGKMDWVLEQSMHGSG